MTDIKINRWPAIIVANYRTGSTVYATHLAKQHNVPYYLEPWNRPELRGDNWGPHVNGMKQNFYEQFHSRDNKYILKFMPDQINKFTPYAMLLKSNCFKIKLYRENEIDNIISNYVAAVRKKWWAHPTETFENYTLKIDDSQINKSIGVTTQNNFWLHSLNVEYDEILTYESLGIIPPEDYIKTHMPDNLEDIRNRITEIYNNLY
jgi:hypothetical protein